jgi:hypothetical protein
MTRVDRTSDQRACAREYFDRRAWNRAYVSFVEADQASPLDVDDLERLATSAYLSGRLRGCMEAFTSSTRSKTAGPQERASVERSVVSCLGVNDDPFSPILDYDVARRPGPCF